MIHRVTDSRCIGSRPAILLHVVSSVADSFGPAHDFAHRVHFICRIAMPDRPSRQAMAILSMESFSLGGSADRAVADLRHVANKASVFKVIFGRVRSRATIDIFDG